MNKVSVDRRCKKCGGNLFLYKDYNGWYEQCLQCSYTRDLEIIYQACDKTNKTDDAARVQVPGK